MHNDFNEFLNHLYNRKVHIPTFFADLIKMSRKNTRPRSNPAPESMPSQKSKPDLAHDSKPSPSQKSKPDPTHDPKPSPAHRPKTTPTQDLNLTPAHELENMPTLLSLPFAKDIVIKKIKTLVLVHKEKIMKFGEVVIPAPIGVKIDAKTGKLTVPVEIVPVGDVILNPIIEKNLLINEGFIKLKIIINNPDCPDVKKFIVKEITIPIQSVHEIIGIRPDDAVQEKVKIKSISVMGIPDDTDSQSAGRKINLIIKIIIEVKLIIAREEVVSVLSISNKSLK